MNFNPRTNTNRTIHVVGAGLAGSECALQLANLGYEVVLYEMRGVKNTPAHKTTKFGELVCSNSLGSMLADSATGQMKAEARQLGSHVLDAAYQSYVPSGQALGVDRELFSQIITEKIRSQPRIRVVNKVVTHINEVPRPCVIATGPLTDESLAESLSEHFGEEFLYFYDAIAPIVDADSIDMSIAWKQSRWDKGTADYINCPMNKEQYFRFIEAVKGARKVEPKEFEREVPYFESCLPIEVLVERGDLTPAYGPMSPKGLLNPHVSEADFDSEERKYKRPYAVVQLRQDNKAATAYNIVGFQTKMAYPEQQRVFRMIPGLENADFLKLGSIHRNMYINAPQMLACDLSSRKDPWLFFAGQISGVEGYFDSTVMGLLVAHFIHQKLTDMPFTPPPAYSAMGALLAAITVEEKENFQPTNINFGLFPPLNDAEKTSKAENKKLQISKAADAFADWHKTLLNYYKVPHTFSVRWAGHGVSSESHR